MLCPTSRWEVGSIWLVNGVYIRIRIIGLGEECTVGGNSRSPCNYVTTMSGSKLTRDRVPKIKITLRIKLDLAGHRDDGVTNS